MNKNTLLSNSTTQDGLILTPGLMRDQRRREARMSDVRRLLKEMDIPVLGFKWEHRYDANYVCQYARKKGWNQGRLNRAITSIDRETREGVCKAIGVANDKSKKKSG